MMGPRPQKPVRTAWGAKSHRRPATRDRGTFDDSTLYELDDKLSNLSGRKTAYVRRTYRESAAPRRSEFGSYFGSHPKTYRHADDDAKGLGISSVGYQPERLIAGGALDGGRDRTTQFSLPLHDACWRDDVGRVKFLLKQGARVDTRELVKEKQAIHVACEANALRCLKVLVASGADVDALAIADVTPCHSCCGPNDSIDCLEYLLRHGANACVGDGRGRQPLHDAKTNRADRCYHALLPYAGRAASTARKRHSTSPTRKKHPKPRGWDNQNLYRARRNGARLTREDAPRGDSHVVY